MLYWDSFFDCQRAQITRLAVAEIKRAGVAVPSVTVPGAALAFFPREPGMFTWELVGKILLGPVAGAELVASLLWSC